MKKRISFLPLVLAFLLAFSSCSKDNSASSVEKASAEAESITSETSPYLLSEEADAALNGLTLQAEEVTELAEGITYREHRYADEDGQPVWVYTAEIQKGAALFYTGTPEDGTLLPYTGATLQEEMQAAVADGKNVLLGVNGGFFRMAGDYLPRGLCVKEGEILAENTDRPFFAVLEDGTPKILPAEDYDKYAGEIKTAVAGKGLLLRYGVAWDVVPDEEFGLERHPRTGVGITPDGTVILAVVDGRDPAYSNGASLADLALLFKQWGCTEALNLDGGGSSTFVIRNSGTGDYTLQNSPSDGESREIQDSLLVLLPEAGEMTKDK